MLTFRAFMQKYPDDGACRAMLAKLRWGNEFCCPRCEEDHYSYIKTRGLYQCLGCGAQSSVTAHTVMHGTKLPLTYWFFTLYWVSSGSACNALKLSKTLKIHYRSALHLLRSIRELMRTCNGTHPLMKIIENNQWIDGESDALSMDADEPVSVRPDHDNDDVTESVPTPMSSGLSSVKPMSTERSSEGLTSNGPLSDVLISSGQSPIIRSSNEQVVKRAQSIMLEKADSFIRSVYRNVHQRYIQGYVDEFYFRWLRRFDRNRERKRTLADLFDALVRINDSACSFLR